MVSIRRTLGSYYSPEPVARLLVNWALKGNAGPVLDPSYGGCAFLRLALDRLRDDGPEDAEFQVFGTDIDGETAPWAAHLISQGVPSQNLLQSDFLALRAGVDVPLAAAVVGNPPYVRHHWMTQSGRANALGAMSRAGTVLSARASLWAYFVIHASTFVRPDGRMALILPGSVLNADYAAAVVAFVKMRFGIVRLVRLQERIFEDAQEESVVLLATHAGSQSLSVQYTEARTVSELGAQLELGLVASPHKAISSDLLANSKLQALDSNCQRLLLDLEADPRTTELGDCATIRIGTVTGFNKMFVRTAREVDALGLLRFSKPILSRSSWITSSLITEKTLKRWESVGRRTRIISVPANAALSRDFIAEIRSAEDSKVHERRHCNREPWWSILDPAVPDAFLPYMGSNYKGVVVNEARLSSTNAIHQLTWKKNSVSNAKLMAQATWSSYSRLTAEIFGRHYGGGVHKLEIRDARRLRLLTAEALETADKLRDARDDADDLLRKVIGLTEGDLAILRKGITTLALRRSPDARRNGESPEQIDRLVVSQA